MNILQQKIKEEGKLLAGDVVKVGSFLNHQVDVNLLSELSKLIKEHFKDKKIDKVLTLEASGIALAYACAFEFNVPLLFAKKASSSNVEETLTSKVHSYTYDKDYLITVDKNFCHEGENILIVDDFLAYGNAVNGLIDIVNQANMNLVGIAIAIEKGFQEGGKEFRDKGYDLYSIAIIDRIENNEIIFR